MDIGFQLITWYNENKRDLPWRNTKNAYEIWLSEIILQQTKVDQGLPYFKRFIDRFPTIDNFANASEDEILKLWQGLGYYSRARNMHKTAQQIMNQYRGKFPISYDQLITLKGIGPYTAAAIASFSNDEKVAVVDGNVFRVLSRLFAIEVPIDSVKVRKVFFDLAMDVMANHPPATFNQAIMEYGAMYCKPKSPDCFNCILNTTCQAYLSKKVNQYPVKGKKSTSRKRYFHYLVLKSNDQFYLNKRTKKDIWQHLYDFPLIETASNTSENEIFTSIDFKNIVGNADFTVQNISEEYTHILSHQLIHAKFYELSMRALEYNTSYILVAEPDLSYYPFPKLIDEYLKKSL